MIEIKNVSKKFGEIIALDGINISLPESGVVGMLGPNGAGKTTLIRILTGYLTSNSGNIVWNNQDVDTKSIEYKSKIGYLPEGNPVYGYMSVIEYLIFVGSLKKITNLTDEIKVVLKSCSLTEVVGQRIDTLSKGYKQRVGLASAIMGKPELLVLDEPTSGLDPNQIRDIRKLIKDLAKEKIVVWSTHILPEAKDVCDRLVMISKGKVVLDEITNMVTDIEKKFIQLTS